jgi:hypothetical protein
MSSAGDAPLSFAERKRRRRVFLAREDSGWRTEKPVSPFFSGRTLIAKPVLQFPNAQRRIHECLGSGKAIVGRNLAVTDFLHRRLLHGTGPLFS